MAHMGAFIIELLAFGIACKLWEWHREWDHGHGDGIIGMGIHNSLQAPIVEEHSAPHLQLSPQHKKIALLLLLLLLGFESHELGHTAPQTHDRICEWDGGNRRWKRTSFRIRESFAVFCCHHDEGRSARWEWDFLVTVFLFLFFGTFSLVVSIKLEFAEICTLLSRCWVGKDLECNLLLTSSMNFSWCLMRKTEVLGFGFGVLDWGMRRWWSARWGWEILGSFDWLCKLSSSLPGWHNIESLRWYGLGRTRSEFVPYILNEFVTDFHEEEGGFRIWVLGFGCRMMMSTRRGALFNSFWNGGVRPWNHH